MARTAFEEVLGAMARAGLVRFTDAVFEKDVPLDTLPERWSLTPAADAIDEAGTAHLLMKDETAAIPAKRKRKDKRTRSGKRQKAEKQAPVASRPQVAGDTRIEEALRKWRLAEAKRHGVPAFRIFTDQALKAVAAKRPGTAAELLAIPGIGSLR